MDVDLDHLKAAHKIDMEKTDRDTAHKMMKKSLGSKYNKDHANWSINAFREEVEQIDEKDNENKRKLKSYAARLGSNFRRDNDKIRHQGLGSAVDKHIGRMVMKGEPHDDIKKYAQGSVQKNPNVSMNLQKIRSKYAKEEVELEEGDASYKKKPDHKPMSDVIDRKKTVKDLMKGRQYFGTGKVKEDGDCVTKPQAKDIAKKEIKGHEKKMHKEEALNEITTISHEPSADKDTAVDMLRGRVQGDGKTNSFLSYKRKLEGDGIKNPEPEQIAKDSTPARKSIDAKGGGIDPVEIKQDSRYGARKEEYDLDEAKQPETDNVPFAKPYNTTSSPVVTDKSGAKHTPMSRARDLARQALKRMKKENMLGKAPGNN